MAGPIERRRYKRVPVKVPAGIYFKSDPSRCIEAELLDLSLGGAFVHCTAPIRVGDEILLEIRFAETHLIEAKVIVNAGSNPKPSMNLSEKVVVRWARGSSQAGFGVEFVGLEPKNKEYLSKLLAYFEELKRSGVHLPNR